MQSTDNLWDQQAFNRGQHANANGNGLMDTCAQAIDPSRSACTLGPAYRRKAAPASVSVAPFLLRSNSTAASNVSNSFNVLKAPVG